MELHRVLEFKRHIETAAAKAESTALMLSRLMPNIGGSRQQKRKLLASMVNSQLLYASPVWANAQVFDSYVDIIERLQRIMVLRGATAYSTASLSAVMVISGTISAHLMVWERQERYGRKIKLHSREKDAEARKEIYRKW